VARHLANMAVVAFALGLSGCGAAAGSDSSERFRGDERVVAQAVEDFRDAAQGGENGRLCRELLARELAQRFARAGGGDCLAGVRDAVRDADSFRLEVQDVTVQGGQATARVTTEVGAREQADTIELVREANRWKVSALGAQA
jgi:hypothetical protein